jgi:hypothetical protein
MRVHGKTCAGYWQNEIHGLIYDRLENEDLWNEQRVPPEAIACAKKIREKFAHLLQLDPETRVPRNWPEARAALQQIEKDPFGAAD